LAQGSQNVVRSYGRYHVPNNHSKYRTSSSILRARTPAVFQYGHGRSRVHAPYALVSKPLNFYPAGGQERAAGSRRGLRRHSGKRNFPLRSLKLAGQLAAVRIRDFYHIKPVRQAVIQPPPDILQVTHGGEREF
jgi:hypothetical protein